MEKSEGEDLDYKRTHYALTMEAAKGQATASDPGVRKEQARSALNKDREEFIKDVVALANSCNEDAHVIVGVEESGGRPGRFLGVERRADIEDDTIQKLADKIDPRPKVRAGYHEHGGLWYFVVKVAHTPELRPFQRRTDGGAGDKGGTVWVRRGSSTAVASPAELVRLVESRWIAERRQLSVEGLRAAELERLLRGSLGHSVPVVDLFGHTWHSVIVEVDQFNVTLRPGCGGPSTIALSAISSFRQDKSGGHVVSLTVPEAAARLLGPDDDGCSVHVGKEAARLLTRLSDDSTRLGPVLKEAEALFRGAHMNTPWTTSEGGRLEPDGKCTLRVSKPMFGHSHRVSPALDERDLRLVSEMVCEPAEEEIEIEVGELDDLARSGSLFFVLPLRGGDAGLQATGRASYGIVERAEISRFLTKKRNALLAALSDAAQGRRF